MSKVKAPNGLSIARVNSKFKASWKKGDSYSTMQYKWGYERNGKEKHLSSETTSSTKATRTFSAPISKVIIFVRGKKSGKWSDWSRKAYNVYAPMTPALSQSLVQTNKTTYTWTNRTDNKERPVDGAKVQTVLVQDCPGGTDALASLKEWKTATTESKAASGSITPVNGAGEDSATLAGKSYTRVVRVKEYGLGGESGWKYIKHVYATPKPAVNVRGVVKETDASLNCEAYWETPSDAGHPIDSVVVQYAIDTPESGMECPDGASWTSMPEQSNTSGTEGKFFTIGTPIGLDKCLFLQVVTTHDTETAESIPVLAEGGVGALTAPTFTEAPSITSSSITIKADNESAVADSFVVDYLEREDGSTEILGLHDTATKVYQVTGIENARVGLKAFVGTWNSTLKQVENVIMESAMTWSSGAVPVAPAITDFDLEQSTVANTVNVTWKYSWSDADACEVSWSKEPDAWISNEEPDYYIVLKGTTDKLAIKGIEAGEPLYVRLRYIKGFDDDAIFSPYSDIKTITIATVPAIPTLTLEKEFYTEGEDVTCSWVYVTADGTEQAQATLAERIITTENNQTVTTYNELISVFTDQKVVIPNTWTTGTQHTLVVKVANGSGNWSDWSAPVVITIAEPIECEIEETSLEYKDEPVNPETYTGDIVTITNEEDNIKLVTKAEVALEPQQDLNGYDKPWSGGNGKNKAESLTTLTTYTSADIIWTTADGYTIHVQGTASAQSLCALASDWSKLFHAYLPAGTYRASTDSDINLRVGVGVSNTNQGNAAGGFSFTLASDNDVWIGLFVASGKQVNKDIHVQIEAGSTATDYEPYSNICPITGASDVDVNVADDYDDPQTLNTYTTSLGTTVYGGSVDVVAGELTPTIGKYTGSDCSWTYSTAGGGCFIGTLPSNTPPITATGADGCLSDTYLSAYDGTEKTLGNIQNGEFLVNTNKASASYKRIVVKDNRYSDATAFSSAVSSVVFTIPYDTTTTSSITPTTVNLIEGTNYVFSPQGEITVDTADAIESGYVLDKLPMTATVTGAGTGGNTVLIIKRAADYRIERPEGEDFKGHKDEVVFQRVYVGEGQQTISLSDTELKGHLDDTAQYILYASIQDEYGQFDDAEIPFSVDWQYKAVKPTATVSIDGIANITIGTPTGTHDGDYVDIYRNSIDGTELIYTGAQFGGQYVDPYPTIGNFGYLFVGRNAYGDFITGGDEYAWTSVSAKFTSEQTLIDFNGEQIALEYNVDLSHSWNKDFKKTKYLGGTIVGDYMAGVERSGSINTVSIPIIETTMLESMRRLAKYQGVCHVRTKEGSTFTADIEVSEEEPHEKAGYVRSFSLSVEKVDPIEPDGMTLAEWEAQ